MLAMIFSGSFEVNSRRLFLVRKPSKLTCFPAVVGLPLVHVIDSRPLL